MTFQSDNMGAPRGARRFPEGSLGGLIVFLALFALFVLSLLAASDQRYGAQRSGPAVPAASTYSDWHGNVAPSPAR